MFPSHRTILIMAYIGTRNPIKKIVHSSVHSLIRSFVRSFDNSFFHPFVISYFLLVLCFRERLCAFVPGWRWFFRRRVLGADARPRRAPRRRGVGRRRRRSRASSGWRRRAPRRRPPSCAGRTEPRLPDLKWRGVAHKQRSSQ